MNRVLSTFGWDVRLQFRNGFYYVSAFVAAVLVIALRQLSGVDWSHWWPPILLENLVVNAFYFMAGLVLLEKGEGTLEAQIVTPLRSGEYLVSKVLSLGLLSLLESFVIVILVSGLAFDGLLLAVGVLLLIALLALYGFLVVARYDSITEFILPSTVWTMGLSLPLLDYFGIWRSRLMYLHPLQAPLVLMRAAFEPVPRWQILYGLVYASVWIWIAYRVTRRAFHRFVIAKAGAKTK